MANADGSRPKEENDRSSSKEEPEAEDKVAKSSAAYKAAAPYQTPPLRRYVRYVLGFTVSVGVGLAPYLGRVEIPLFDPLSDLIPDSLQDTIFPLSAALMGLVSIVVQWYGYRRLSPAWMHQVFKKILGLALASFAALIVVHTFVVVAVPVDGGKTKATFLVGFSRPDAFPCTIYRPAEIGASVTQMGSPSTQPSTAPAGAPLSRQRLSDRECIRKLSFDEAQIAGFWGDGQVRLARLALMAGYFAFTSAIGLLIGLIFVRQEQGQHYGDDRR